MSRSGFLFTLMSLGVLAGCAKDPQPAAGPPGQTVVTPPLAGEKKASAAESEKETTASSSSDKAAPKATTESVSPRAAVPKGPTTVQLNLDYVTDDIVAAAVFHPRRVLESPFVAALQAEGATREEDVEKMVAEFRTHTSLNLREVEELILLTPRRLVDATARDVGLPLPEDPDQAPTKPPQDHTMNLRMLGLAFHNYESVNRRFPKAGGPAEETDSVKDGLSWRVQLLPYLDQQDLYDQFHHDEPWDSEHNKTLIEKMPDLFATADVEEPGKTSIHVFTSAGAPFADNAAPGIRDYTDGTSNTLLAVVAGPEAAEVWTKPGGLEVDADDPTKCLGTPADKSFLALFTDGSVRKLPSDIEPTLLANLVMHADGNVVQVPEGDPIHAQGPFLMPFIPQERMPIVAVKMSNDVNQAEILARLPGAAEASTPGGQAYFAAENWAFAFPANDLVLFGQETALKEWLDKSTTASKGSVSAQLRAVDRPFDAVFAVDLSPYAELLATITQQNPFAGPLANVRSLTLSSDLSGKPGDPLLALAGTSSSSETAKTLADLLNGMLQGQLQFLLAQFAQNANDESQEIRDILRPSLEKLEIKTDGATLSLQLPIPEGFDRLPKLIAPVVQQQRQMSETMQKRNNLKQIALAFHNYHDVYNSFPKAGGAGTDDPKVKGALSWRVFLLPLLGHAELYAQFHLDEPWDSEHNQTLIEKMPDIFTVDGVEEPGKTSIHVFTGPGAPFSDERAPGIRDFTDGTSNTFLCVSAGPDKADIWTKPGGLEFDPENPFEALGELGETFLALLADGAVLGLPKTLEPANLRRYIQMADGEIQP